MVSTINLGGIAQRKLSKLQLSLWDVVEHNFEK